MYAYLKEQYNLPYTMMAIYQDNMHIYKDNTTYLHP